MATSGHVLTACGTGHDSLPWPREARGSGGHVPPAGAGREREGGGAAAGGERCRSRNGTPDWRLVIGAKGRVNIAIPGLGGA